MQIADPHIFRQNDTAAVSADFSGNDAEKRAFSCTIGADNTDMISGIDPETDMVKEYLFSVTF